MASATKAMTIRKRAEQGELIRTGRPSKYSSMLANEILERISAGESLLSITKEEHMPDRVSVYRWIEAHEEFRNNYARAKELQAETYEDMMLDTARTEDDVNRARLIVDTMKWTASKLKPKKYGDKVDLTTNGKDLPSPLLGGIALPNVSSSNSDT